MKVITNFCKKVINLAVSFNLYYYDVNNNKFNMLVIVDSKDVNSGVGRLLVLAGQILSFQNLRGPQF